jgi:hypothetical protein
MDLASSFRALVREIVGLPADEGQPPQIDRLAHYRARVDVCASDGSTVDVTPEDRRISPEKNVPLRVGIPGSYAVVQAGAVVWLGWDAGNPSKPHCVPTWESATVTKLVLKATSIYLGDESGTDALVKKSEFNNHTHPAAGAIAPAGTAGGACSGTIAAPTSPATGTTNVQAK